MRWVEVLEFRSFGNDKALLEPNLSGLFDELGQEKTAERIEIYGHVELKSDWSIHIHCSSDSMKATKSPLGVRLVSLLSKSGFVHHGIWSELRRYEQTKSP